MTKDDDGHYTYAVAHQHPLVHNWSNSGGMRRMIFGHRWQAFSSAGQAKHLRYRHAQSSS